MKLKSHWQAKATITTCQSGQWQLSRRLFEDMIQLQVVPNLITLHAMISFSLIFFKFVTFLLICCWTSNMFLKRYGLKLGESIGLVRFMWWLARSCDISWNDWTTRIPTHCGDLWCCDYGLRKGHKMAACIGVLWNHELLWICFRYGYH